ncbi:hypothetical protein ACFSR6_14655 [Pedobacter vanadiisoli]|uniref:Uncharacterized protein n=1 Tax=Pedobacter vanadiisoli TaxID=1761975 RepID=A0ABW5MKE3_9SPHI
MKIQTIIILLFISISSFGQSNLNELIRQRLITKTPYSTVQASNRNYILKSKLLSFTDVKLVLSGLRKAKHILVNPKGGTAFGDLDNSEIDSSDFEVESLRLIGAFNATNSTLVHLQITLKDDQTPKGILLVLDKNGKIIEWLFSDGSLNSGNPNGNISRELTITKENQIELEETSWGRNTESYKLKAIYKLIHTPTSRLKLIHRKLK